jgi:hypothetical protein
MTPRREPTWIRLLRPPLVAIGFVASTIYAGLFGWWLDARLSKKNGERFANEVKHDLQFLFSEKAARIVPTDDYRVQRAFDRSVVTVATDAFWIRFIRLRGDFNVEVASAKLPHRWEDLSGALENAEMREGATLNDVVATRQSRAYSTITDVERLLRNRWETLRAYCSSC